jgi:hypothetical protein
MYSVFLKITCLDKSETFEGLNPSLEFPLESLVICVNLIVGVGEYEKPNQIEPTQLNLHRGF